MFFFYIFKVHFFYVFIGFVMDPFLGYRFIIYYYLLVLCVVDR